MKYDFTQARKCIETLDKRRFDRALLGSGDAFRHIVSLVPLLLHLNHPALPGYVEDALAGIADFTLSNYQQNFLSKEHPELVEAVQSTVNSDAVFAQILGIYVMGSFGSISQTSASDLDIWICHQDDLSEQEQQRLAEKTKKISQWASTYHVEMHFYLMTQQRFRNERYSDPLTKENSGSAQYMLLLEEFYRSAVRLAGKPLLWLHLWVEDEKQYEAEVARLVEAGELNLNDWVDFGGLGQFSASEYFGASLWQLYKGIDSPYKSVMKILLLETYAQEYPNAQLIARQFKEDLLSGHSTAIHHFDPYIAILERISQYLTAHSEFKRLDFVRSCFYVKATEDFALYHASNWRISYMKMMAQEWGWSKERIESSVIPQDITVLSRKLYTAFEELPGKITLLNSQISYNLTEEHLTFIEVHGNKRFKDGWYMVNQPPHHIMFSKERVIEYGESLNKVVAWAYFNRLLTAETHLHLISQNIDQLTLRNFVADLRLFFPHTNSQVPTNEALSSQCEIRDLFIAVNLVNDPTAQVEELKSNISPSDLFSFGQLEQSLVGSIDFTYRNVWNEIRTLHFEGQNAILLALKVLSNKIDQGVNQPRSVQVFCYSKHYNRTLRNLVSVLVNRCISIQLGDSRPTTHSRLRVAGKNWQFFFEEKGISLQPIEGGKESADNFEDVLPTQLEEKEIIPEARRYPPEIDLFASEGFLQFFFEDNADNSFNVYLLDEKNRLEIYRQCEGSKDDKVREINRIYQSLGSNDCENPYKMVQRNFNYPQFYQLHSTESGMRIMPFKFKSKRTCE
ncbi:MAG: class I adenylate cyclase [Haemophilus parainfluenzae]|nr:class I adenylate cyclase [Haemophilus parainfluenzae]